MNTHKSTQLSNAILCLGLLLYSSKTSAQKIMKDSRGKDVFEYHKAGSIQSELSPTQTSLTVTYNLVSGIPTMYYVNGDKTQKTVTKSHSFSFSGKVEGSGTDEGKAFSLNKGLVRPSYRLELGYQRNINTFHDLNLLPNGRNFTYIIGGSVYGEYQNLNFYDTLTKTQSNIKPLIYGAHGHGTLFYGRGPKKGLFKELSLAFSVSADLASSYDQALFVRYAKQNGQIYTDNNIVAISDVEGNIGTFERTGFFRVRGSLPVFVSSWLALTPYTSVYGFKTGKTNYMHGFAVNFFSGAPRAKENTLTTGFGFSVDWPKIKGERKAALSIYGSFALEKALKLINQVAEPL